MEASNILSADVLDIIFDARNKEYGAYDLRKNYQRRLTKALVSMVLIVLLLLVTYLLVAAAKPKGAKPVEAKDIDLVQVTPPDNPITPPPPPIPPPPPPTAVKMLAFTSPPVIVKEASPEEMPPPVDDIDNAKIGTVNTNGTDDAGIVGPPVEVAKGVVEVPKKQDEGETIFTKVEIESQYPGGISAWTAFLNRKLNYPQLAIDNEIQGTVVIQFIVDLQGNVSDVIAISGPDELKQAAINVIKQSSKWSAAIQNGKPVKSYKKQPITFKLPEG